MKFTEQDYLDVNPKGKWRLVVGIDALRIEESNGRPLHPLASVTFGKLSTAKNMKAELEQLPLEEAGRAVRQLALEAYNRAPMRWANDETVRGYRKDIDRRDRRYDEKKAARHQDYSIEA